MKKENILETSEQVFFSKRYADITLDQIAHALDIQKPSLYHYFKNKKELFLQTLMYSKQKFFEAFKKELAINDSKTLIIRYLTYPVKHKNLFSIAFQKGFCSDTQARKILYIARQDIMKALKHFFENNDLSDIQIYLLLNLIEKLTQNNCMEEYCLQHSPEELAENIIGTFL